MSQKAAQHANKRAEGAEKSLQDVKRKAELRFREMKKENSDFHHQVVN